MSYYDASRAGRAHVTHRGTLYALSAALLPAPLASLAGGELERAALRENIRRVCDADDRQSYATLPTRHTTTLADALRWARAAQQ